MDPSLLPPKISVDATSIDGQVAKLPVATATYTTHDEKTGKAVMHRLPDSEAYLRKWQDVLPTAEAAMFTLFTTGATPVSTRNDLAAHVSLLNDNDGHAPLNMEGGTIARMVDYGPGFIAPPHRTHTIDVGVVIEGSVELFLDSGETSLIKRGGMIVQRGTMHGWRNPDPENWARVFYISIASEPRFVSGKELPRDLGVLGHIEPDSSKM